MTELRQEEYRNDATMEIWGASAAAPVRYELLSSHLEQDGVSYLTYGIRCLGRQMGGWVQMDAVPDVSFHQEEVTRLADLFNRLQLSPVHFRDAVLDCVNA